MDLTFEERLADLWQKQEVLLNRTNECVGECNGIVYRYVHPVITREHIPLEWRYDLNPDTNPYCMERIGVNIYYWFVLRDGIESLFLLLLKVPMEWIISDFGIYQ